MSGRYFEDLGPSPSLQKRFGYRKRVTIANSLIYGLEWIGNRFSRLVRKCLMIIYQVFSNFLFAKIINLSGYALTLYAVYP